MWLSHCCFYVMQQNDDIGLMRPKGATSSQPRATNAELETSLMLWSTFGLEI